MSLWKNYLLPPTVHDALVALHSAPGSASLIAGGTDLLLDLQQGRHTPVDTLIDITRVHEMLAVDLRGEYLFVGAAVPLTKIVTSPLIHSQAQALIEACGLIGGPQVRNTATLGGNVAHALPAGDGTIALHALGAEAEVAGHQGWRRVPIETLFLGPGKSALDPRKEILTGFYLPLSKPGSASAFKRIMRPQGVALPVLNLSVWVVREGEHIADIRIALGPAGPTPLRARQTEQALRGQRFDAGAVTEALAVLGKEAKFRSSAQRATAAYRQHLAGDLFRQTLTTAWQRTFVLVPRSEVN